jgi:hypothetical protein
VVVVVEQLHITQQWAAVEPEQLVRQDKDMMAALEIVAGEAQVLVVAQAQQDLQEHPAHLVLSARLAELAYKAVLPELLLIMQAAAEQEIIAKLPVLAD